MQISGQQHLLWHLNSFQQEPLEGQFSNSHMPYCREHGNTLTSSNIYKPLEMTCNCSHVFVQLLTDSLLWTKKAAQPMQMAWSNHKSPDFFQRFKLGLWTTNSKELGTARQVSHLPHSQNKPSTPTPNLYQSKFCEASETRKEESLPPHYRSRFCLVNLSPPWYDATCWWALTPAACQAASFRLNMQNQAGKQKELTLNTTRLCAQ